MAGRYAVAGSFYLEKRICKDNDRQKSSAFSCFGMEYYPEAFEPKVFEHAACFASDETFYAAYKHFVLLVLADVEKLVSERMALIREIQRKTPESLPLPKVSWCALCFATDRYFNDKSKLHKWSKSQTEDIRTRWYEILAKAFVPTQADRLLELSDLYQWKDDFLNLVQHQMRNDMFITAYSGSA